MRRRSEALQDKLASLGNRQMEIDAIEKFAAEHRKMCVDKMLLELSSGCIKLVIDEAQLRKACLNTGENDV